MPFGTDYEIRFVFAKYVESEPPKVPAATTTTGLLEKVRYHADATYDDAEYFYDGMGRLNKIEDWLGGNGLRYAYDAAGPLTTLRPLSQA